MSVPNLITLVPCKWLAALTTASGGSFGEVLGQLLPRA